VFPEFTILGFLWVLLLLPLLLWWWFRQRRGGLRHPATSALAALPAARRHWALWGGAILRALALAALIVAVAGPRWPDRKTRIETEGISIELVVDLSSSSGVDDFEWDGVEVTRLEAIKRAFRLFVLGGKGPDGATLEGRPMDQIGLVTFSTGPDSACPLTLSHKVLLQILDQQQTRTTDDTNIADAIYLGLHRLKHAGPGRKVLVLLSDGENSLRTDSGKNAPSPISGRTTTQAAQRAAALDIPIYSIDPAPESPRPGRISVRDTSSPEVRAAGIRTLREVSEISGGEYFQADDTTKLLQVCRAIDKKERERIESFQYRKYHEGYPWFALGGFLLWGLAFVLERTIWRRLPG